MVEKTVKCHECDWEGPASMLERYQCPQCGSRQLRTEGARLTQEDNRNPPPNAEEGEDFSSGD